MRHLRTLFLIALSTIFLACTTDDLTSNPKTRNFEIGTTDSLKIQELANSNELLLSTKADYSNYYSIIKPIKFKCSLIRYLQYEAEDNVVNFTGLNFGNNNWFQAWDYDLDSPLSEVGVKPLSNNQILIKLKGYHCGLAVLDSYWQDVEVYKTYTFENKILCTEFYVYAENLESGLFNYGRNFNCYIISPNVSQEISLPQ